MSRGCTAHECGLSTFSCNRTGLICANQYLSCEIDYGQYELASSVGLPAGGVGVNGLPFCARTRCLSNYFQCMVQSNCTTQQDLSTHLAICASAGCTPEQCGYNVEPEQPQLPDAPSSVLLNSEPNSRLRIMITPSDVAITWARTGSRNLVLQYLISLEGGCRAAFPSGVGGQELVCEQDFGNSIISAFGSLTFTFERLRIGTLYHVQVKVIYL